MSHVQRLCPICFSRHCSSLETPAGVCPEVPLRALTEHYLALMANPADARVLAREFAKLEMRVDALESKA